MSPLLLHELAVEVSPQRSCRILFGRHTIFASWLRLGLVDVDFGQGQRPRLFDGVFPFFADNSAYVFEGIHGGVTLSLALQAEVMERMLTGPTLRKFRAQ